MKITLTMDEEIAWILMDATEFYGRVLCGQYEEIARKVANVQYERLRDKTGPEANKAESSELWDLRNKAETALLWPKKVQFPELEELGHHHGRGYSHTTDISYNVYQAVRYALAWHRHPKGGVTVDYNAPSASEKPVPKVEIDGKCYIKGNLSFESEGRQ